MLSMVFFEREDSIEVSGKNYLKSITVRQVPDIFAFIEGDDSIQTVERFFNKKEVHETIESWKVRFKGEEYR